MSIAFSQVPDNFDIKRLILSKHAGLFDSGLTAHHYDIVCRHFEETLRDLGVDPAAVEQAKSVVTPLREVFAQGKADSVRRRRTHERRHTVLLVIVTGIIAYGTLRLLRSRKSH